MYRKATTVAIVAFVLTFLALGTVVAQPRVSPVVAAMNCLGLDCGFVNSLNTLSERIAPEYALSDLADSNGILAQSAVLLPGDVFYRPDDGVTRVEAGYYIVPSNRVFADRNGDGIIRPDESVLTRIVVVSRDNLTFLFREGTSQVQGIFPNGTGKAGASSVTRLGRVNVILGPEWGLAESIREFSNLPTYRYPDGTMPNYFGSHTIGTYFYMDDDPVHDIDSRQEVHGTFVAHAGSVDGANLLGTEISGGCIRHRNQDIDYMVANVRPGELVLTVTTPEDDAVDNQWTIYNRTRLAADLLPVALQELSDTDREATLLRRPANATLRMAQIPAITTSTWFTFDQIGYPTTFLPVEHPFTRGNYSIIPCGSETLWITSVVSGRQILTQTDGRYRLVLPPQIDGPNGQPINVADFYTPTEVTFTQVEQKLNRLSLGDPEASIFEYLFSDLAYQYAAYSVQRDNHGQLNPAQLELAVADMSGHLIRETQLVTGVLPVAYYTGSPGSDGIPGDRLGIMTNRTMSQHAMNVFYGSTAPTWELDPRENLGANSFLLRDQQVWSPAMDNEVERTGAPAVGSTDLITRAVRENRPIVFRISYYRYLADLSFFKNMPAGHYYALIPEYTDLDAGYIGIYDTMHPYAILLVPFAEVPQLFTTVTIGP